VVVYQRRYEEQTAVVAFNAGNNERSFSIHQALPDTLVDGLDPDEPSLRTDDVYTLPPQSGRVWASG
ncbi:MAG: hypothetical protein RRC07_17210, partial [Anaerolineae bacterium]|nr:hypothetical protein [Anaerolineae bacterium]